MWIIKTNASMSSYCRDEQTQGMSMMVHAHIQLTKYAHVLLSSQSNASAGANTLCTSMIRS